MVFYAFLQNISFMRWWAVLWREETGPAVKTKNRSQVATRLPIYDWTGNQYGLDFNIHRPHLLETPGKTFW